MPDGGCHCGAVRYQISGQALHHALCHCVDCRGNAGAPVVGWIAFADGDVTIHGATTTYASSEHGRREFCPQCGTGLFYRNAQVLPGIIDIQSATLDNIADMSPGAQIQMAERLPWFADIDRLPKFDRYPSMGGE
ncbi:MAG: GFA family protein [Sphingomonadaceae bacterium]|nr:GFA family protein [Sphingomonadaceae bacterium]